jgi:hypothetical protein
MSSATKQKAESVKTGKVATEKVATPKKAAAPKVKVEKSAAERPKAVKTKVEKVAVEPVKIEIAKVEVSKVEKPKVEKPKVAKPKAEPVVSAKPVITPAPAPVETQESRVAAAVADERRFCSSCSRTKPVLGGVMALCANGTKRWKCVDCHARSKAHLASVKKSQ